MVKMMMTMLVVVTVWIQILMMTMTVDQKHDYFDHSGTVFHVLM